MKLSGTTERRFEAANVMAQVIEDFEEDNKEDLSNKVNQLLKLKSIVLRSIKEGAMTTFLTKNGSIIWNVRIFKFTQKLYIDQNGNFYDHEIKTENPKIINEKGIVAKGYRIDSLLNSLIKQQTQFLKISEARLKKEKEKTANCDKKIKLLAQALEVEV